MSRSRWKHYLPAGIAVLLAWVFLSAPELAALLLAGALLVFAASFALIVRRMHKAMDSVLWRDGITASGPPHSASEPTFRNVTIRIFRDGSVWFREMVD